MRELLVNFLEFMKDVDYGDARFVWRKSEEIRLKNGEVDMIGTETTQGIGIRVLIKGRWGFSATSDLSFESVLKAFYKAKELAVSQGKLDTPPITLSEENRYVDKYETQYKIDPFSISTDKKIQLLQKIDDVLRTSKYVVSREEYLKFILTEQIFVSTEGSIIEQKIVESGGGYEIYARKDDILVKRSYPNSHGGNMRRAGWEFIEDMKLLENAPRICEEAEALLFAKPLDEGEMDLVIHNSQMALQIHESVGHALELDRVLGWERGYAGDSFATPEKLNNFKYGSPLMNITSDSTIPGGLGTYGYDDEGVKAQRVYLVKDGILVNYLSSRDTASYLGLKSTGASRAYSWNRPPIVRMTNVNLEPGVESLEELIEGVKDGLFIMNNLSWSIDQKRLNFQFATEIGWRIKNGKLTEIVRAPIYTGITPEFWNKLDGLGNDWYLWGLQNCGKGEPHQVMHTGHGTPSARFRKIRVGSLR